MSPFLCPLQRMVSRRTRSRLDTATSPCPHALVWRLSNSLDVDFCYSKIVMFLIDLAHLVADRLRVHVAGDDSREHYGEVERVANVGDPPRLVHDKDAGDAFPARGSHPGIIRRAVVGVCECEAELWTALLDESGHLLLGVIGVRGRVTDERHALVRVLGLQLCRVGHEVDAQAAPGGPELDDVDLIRLEIFDFFILKPFAGFQGRNWVAHLEQLLLLILGRLRVVGRASDGDQNHGDEQLPHRESPFTEKGRYASMAPCYSILASWLITTGPARRPVAFAFVGTCCQATGERMPDSGFSNLVARTCCLVSPITGFVARDSSETQDEGRGAHSGIKSPDPRFRILPLG